MRLFVDRSSWIRFASLLLAALVTPVIAFASLPAKITSYDALGRLVRVTRLAPLPGRTPRYEYVHYGPEGHVFAIADSKTPTAIIDIVFTSLQQPCVF